MPLSIDDFYRAYESGDRARADQIRDQLKQQTRGPDLSQLNQQARTVNRAANEPPRAQAPPPSRPGELPHPSSVDNRPSTPRTARTVEAPLRQPAQVAVAEPPRPMPRISPLIERLPPAIPQAIKPGATGGVLTAAVDLPLRLISGQSIGQAALGATGSGLGSFAGAVIGSTLGPAGFFVGGAIGGFIGGAIADSIYGLAAPKRGHGVSKDALKGELPFKGGQSSGVSYGIYLNDEPEPRLTVTGPISSAGIVAKDDQFGQCCWTIVGAAASGYFELGYICQYDSCAVTGGPPGDPASLSVRRNDGQPDTGGNPPGMPFLEPKRTPSTTNHPLAQPTTHSNGQTVVGTEAAALPGGTKSYENGTARGDSPNWVPHGAPSGSPNPATVPQNLGKDLPTTQGADGKPKEKTETIPYLLNPSPALQPAHSPSKVSKAGTPLPTTKPADVEPEAFPVPKAQLESKAATSNECTDLGWAWSCGFGQWPHGASKLGVSGQSYADPLTDKAGTGNFATGLGGPITTLAAGLPLVVGRAAEPTGNRLTRPDASPPAPDYSNSANTCEIDPCLSGIQRKTQENGGKLDRLLDGANLAGTGAGALANQAGIGDILKRLEKMDAKLGPQIPKGGIGGFLTNMFKGIDRLADFFQVDRLLNAMTFITVLHNAYFLSSGLSSTLFSAISNSLAIFGIKDSEGSPLDIAKMFNQTIDSFAKRILGVDTVDGIKAAWKKYSRVYQAAANIMFSMQSILWSIQEVLEVIGENVNRIGNALRKWGVVGEKAYGWMNEKMSKPGWGGKVDRVVAGLESAENITSNVDSAASEVVSAQDQVTQLGDQKTELQTAIKSAQPKEQTENDPVKNAADAAKANSQSPEIAESDLVKPAN